MEGLGRLGVIGVESPDPLLSLLAALGLAAAAGTALVVDFGGGLQVDRDRTLADLAREGPALTELSPGRSGIALLPAGPMSLGDGLEVIEMLASTWPALVIRGAVEWPGPTVPVRALLPGLLRPSGDTPAVWQPTGSGTRPPGPGPVLPRLGGRTTRSLLSGHIPVRSRWMRAWERVWGLPWA